MLASVESESQKLEHNLEESNVRTKTKIKERLKDENKCFLHKQSKLSVLQTERISSTEYVSSHVCGYETKPILLSLGCSLLSFAYAHSKRNRHLSVQLLCIYLYVLCGNSRPETVTNV